MKINVTYPLVNYGYGIWAKLEEDRSQVWGVRLAVKITKPCIYCNEPVTYTRGAVYSGDPYHWDCYKDTPEHLAQAEAFQKAICGDLTPAQYQAKHGIAWNE